MVTVAWDPSNLAVLFKDGAVCTTCCSYESGTCCPGFGSGQTPASYTAVIADVVDCPGWGGDATIVNGTWQLDLVECEESPFPEEPGCTWQIKNDSVWIALVRNHTLAPCAELSLSALINTGTAESPSWHGVFYDLVSYTTTTGWCSDFTNDYADCTTYGKDGTAKVWPLVWAQWVILTSYFFGDRAYNDDEVYDCTVDHIAVASNEPGTGGDWEDFWDVGDPCGDTNVACP